MTEEQYTNMLQNMQKEVGRIPPIDDMDDDRWAIVWFIKSNIVRMPVRVWLDKDEFVNFTNDQIVDLAIEDTIKSLVFTLEFFDIEE